MPARSEAMVSTDWHNSFDQGWFSLQGNCLFNALSDQLYGHQEMHEVLRTATIEHMRDNSDFYRQYMAVNNVRRNPKRKTTSTMPTRIDTTYFTEEQLQQQFEEHVEKMGQPGEWADNMEVSAFASALNVHVRLWQADYTYLFSPRVLYAPCDDPTAADDRQTLHIAYHVSYSMATSIACADDDRHGNTTPPSASLQDPTQGCPTSTSSLRSSQRSVRVLV
jgi:OTU domain-containing protein 3